jgi:hypothetical protein
LETDKPSDFFSRDGLSQDIQKETCMQSIDFKKAYYVKLGRGGKWEKSSIRENKVRIGWANLTIEEIHQKNWGTLKETYLHEYKTKGAASADINALRTIVESTKEDIWITFHASHLWWCCLGETKIFDDGISKYRKVSGGWNNCDICNHPLIINQIPGSISKVQRFQGTICRIKEEDALKRLLNNQPSPAFQAITEVKRRLAEEVEIGVKGLHWKDFETLVDLVFRNAGWRRTSVIGEMMKFVDMELEEPITGDLYQVQVKSAATLDDYKKYARDFSPENFRKFYFVVHSPDEKLANYQNKKDLSTELILPGQLAQMVVNLGLTDWLLKKIR